MVYMRIDRGKFWGWVIVAGLIGLLVGAGFTYLLGGSEREQLALLQGRLAVASAAASATADLQTQLQSAEASVTSLTSQNSHLASDLAAAQAASKSGSSSSSSSSTGTVSFISRDVQPNSITTSGTMTLVVKLNGHPSSVKMRVVGQSGLSFDQTYSLGHSSTSGTTQTWKATVHAPTKKGDYRFYATAYVGSHSFVMPGVSAWMFEVD
jgi:uncharacterized protein (UPF0333 family)